MFSGSLEIDWHFQVAILSVQQRIGIVICYDPKKESARERFGHFATTTAIILYCVSPLLTGKSELLLTGSIHATNWEQA